MLRAVVALLLLMMLPSVAHADKRVALVIGDSAYKHAGELANPKNDAADMAAAFKQHGFQVLEGFDLDKTSLDRKIREFAAALSGAAVGVFFYAGHGLQVSGQNYLVPVDAELTTASALDFEMVRVDLVQRTMEREAQTNIIFLDACRNNPLARNLARAMGTRSADIGRGLAPLESGIGTLISFSTQPGNVASDGLGRNSPFAGALVRHVVNSSDSLGDVLIAVRNDVRKETQNKQVPWEHSALTGRFYFSAIQPPPSSTRAQQHTMEAERIWLWMKNTTDRSMLEHFAKEYGDTPLGALAEERMRDLKKQQIGSAPPSAPLPEPDIKSAGVPPALTSHPGKVGARPTTNGNCYEEDVDIRIAGCTDLIQREPGNKFAYIFRAIAHREKKQYLDAIADYSKVIDIDPKNALTYTSRAGVYVTLNQREKAIADYTKAIEIDPKNVEAYTSRGEMYKEAKQYGKAVADYSKAIEIDPRESWTYVLRADTYSVQKQYDKAIVDYTKVIEISPDSSRAYTHRGNAYNDKKLYDRAIADYSKAIEIEPENGVAYNMRGNAYSDKKLYDRAIADYSKAIEIDRDDSSAHYNRAIAYEAKKLHDKAIADYTKAIELDPNNVDAYNNRGLSYESKGDRKRAMADYRKVLQIDPSDKDAKENLERLGGKP